jgi:hypothetical protein
MGICGSAANKVGMTEEELMLQKCMKAQEADFNAKASESEKEAAVVQKKSKISIQGTEGQKEDFNIFDAYDPSNKYSHVAVEAAAAEDNNDATTTSPEDESALPPSSEGN